MPADNFYKENYQIKRRTNVVGIFPNDAAIVRLVGALLLVQNDEWQLQRRYRQLEGLQAVGDSDIRTEAPPSSRAAYELPLIARARRTATRSYLVTLGMPRAGERGFNDLFSGDEAIGGASW